MKSRRHPPFAESLVFLGAALFWFGIMACGTLALIRLVGANERELTIRSSLIDAATFFAFFFSLRWPALFEQTAYIDEQQMLAQAIAATYDLVPWRSFDGTTSGPLNTYALLPAMWFGLPAGALDARCVSLVLGALFIAFTGLALVRICDRRMALGVLAPLLLMVGFGMKLARFRGQYLIRRHAACARRSNSIGETEPSDV